WTSCGPTLAHCSATGRRATTAARHDGSLWNTCAPGRDDSAVGACHRPLGVAPVVPHQSLLGLQLLDQISPQNKCVLGHRAGGTLHLVQPADFEKRDKP